MSAEVITVFVLLVAAVVLFATERLPVDLVALLVLAALCWQGSSLPSRPCRASAIRGNRHRGCHVRAERRPRPYGRGEPPRSRVHRGSAASDSGRTLIALMALIGLGGISAFINNTAAVAIFLPIVLGLARDMRISPSKLLIPLSFASMFGGVCTLIGTSTNILVSSIAAQHGLPPFGMFELLPGKLGVLVLFAVGGLYLLTAGVRLTPDRRTGEDLTQSYGMGDYLTEVLVLPESPAVGRPLRESPLVHDLDLDVLEIQHAGRSAAAPRCRDGPGRRTTCSGYAVTSARSRLAEEQEGIVFLKSGLKWRDADLESAVAALVEAVVAPKAALEGKTIEEAVPQDLRRHGTRHTPPRGADAGQPRGQAAARRRRAAHRSQARPRRRAEAGPDFVIVSEVGLPSSARTRSSPPTDRLRRRRSAAWASFPSWWFGGGRVLLIVTGCVTLEEAYAAIEWRIIFLLAGVLTLGTALENTGAAGLLSGALLSR